MSDDELARFLSTVHFVMPNLNDTFAFACADTEKVSVGDGQLLADFWRRHGWRGLVAIAAVQRGAEPLGEVAATPEYMAARAELLARESFPDEDGEPWTLLDEFELPVPAGSDGETDT